MSDPNHGDPVEENASVDDVVGRAHEGLADAEAAGREAVGEHAPADELPADEPAVAQPEPEPEPEPDLAEPAPTDGPTDGPTDAPAAVSADDFDESAFDDPVFHEASAPVVPAEPAAASSDSLEADRFEDAPLADTVEPVAGPAASPSDDAPDAPDAYDAAVTTAYDTPVEADTVVVPSEPYDPPAAAVAAPAAAPQPIFVQAPEAPTPRGNRAAAGAIGLLAALSFAVLYLAAWLGFGALNGSVTADNVGETTLSALGTWSLWVPVVVFFIAFWLLGAIINRGRWGAWVIFGLLVGIASYGGHILGALFQAPFWMLTATEGAELANSQLLAPLAIAALVIGRELTIWFGSWAAARAKRVTELNIEAQREYERTLEAGPQLVRQ